MRFIYKNLFDLLSMYKNSDNKEAWINKNVFV